MKQSRRVFLMLGAGAAASRLGVSAAEADSLATVDGVRAGVLVGTDGSRRASVRLPDDSLVSVIVNDDANVVHGRAGLVTDLTDFVVGEGVVFEADEPVGDELRTSMFQSIVDALTTTITAGSEDEELSTSVGDFVASENLDNENTASGRARVTYWRDPADGTKYATAITTNT